MPWSQFVVCGVSVWAAICRYMLLRLQRCCQQEEQPEYPFADIASQRAKLNAAEHRKGTSSGEIAVLILPFPAQGLLGTLSRNESQRVRETERDEQDAN
jgi:hypothetical protein